MMMVDDEFYDDKWIAKYFTIQAIQTILKLSTKYWSLDELSFELLT